MTIYCSHFDKSLLYFIADRKSELLEFAHKFDIDLKKRHSNGVPFYSDAISLPTLSIANTEINQTNLIRQYNTSLYLPWDEYMEKRFELMKMVG